MNNQKWTCPACNAVNVQSVFNPDQPVMCGCGWKEGDAMPIPDHSRIERLVIALIGSPNVFPFEHEQLRLPFPTRVVLCAVQINEEIKKAEYLGNQYAATPKPKDHVEWPTDE